MVNRTWSVFFALILVSGCTGPALHTTPPIRNVPSGRQGESGVVHGDFTEYSLPSGANPGVFTKGPNSTLANELTPGPLGYMYITAVATPGAPPPPHNSSVYIMTTGGTILNQVWLPYNSDPYGIATGSDHNLWIAEPGINKIARMAPQGNVKQFAVPTKHAGASWIVGGADGALWFTETKANKIGRLTTAGQFREWNIPTANAGAGPIQYCYPGCGPHYGVWFSETSANQIAKFKSRV